MEIFNKIAMGAIKGVLLVNMTFSFIGLVTIALLLLAAVATVIF